MTPLTDPQWSRDHFNPTLTTVDPLKTKFTYLAFTNSLNPQATGSHTFGTTGIPGSHVFVKPVNEFAAANNENVNDGLAFLAAHELTHMLLNGVGLEDLIDPNNDGEVRGPADKVFLMYEAGTKLNWGTFLFDNLTRGHLGLKVKEFSRA